MSPSLERVTLFSRCLEHPSGAHSLVTQARCSKGVPCVDCVCPPIANEPSLVLACQWVGLILMLTSHTDWPQLLWMSCCMGAHPME